MTNYQEIDDVKMDLTEDGLKKLLPGWNIRLSHTEDGGYSRWYIATSPSGLETYEIYAGSLWNSATKSWDRANVAKLIPKPVVLPLSKLVKQAEK